jgi:hypothetical protein
MASFFPVIAFILWLALGFPAPEEMTVTAYYIQMGMTVLTIAGIPLSLKYISRERFGVKYNCLCFVRMALLCSIATANLVLYYFLCSITAFFYLGVIAWLAMFFAFPAKAKTS